MWAFVPKILYVLPTKGSSGSTKNNWATKREETSPLHLKSSSRMGECREKNHKNPQIWSQVTGCEGTRPTHTGKKWWQGKGQESLTLEPDWSFHQLRSKNFNPANHTVRVCDGQTIPFIYRYFILKYKWPRLYALRPWAGPHSFLQTVSGDLKQEY